MLVDPVQALLAALRACGVMEPELCNVELLNVVDMLGTTGVECSNVVWFSCTMYM
jgi:hypothetical protein